MEGKKANQNTRLLDDIHKCHMNILT